ncbi:MAG: HAD family phosphatase [Bacteroidales bacterium]|nr:HAD family phosphatase [Bacteroidales bacterium]
MIEKINKNLRGIKNIVFDLGGVLLDIDFEATVEAFRKLGLNKDEIFYSQYDQSDLFDKLEIGMIGAEDFVLRVKKILGRDITEEEILGAWNVMIKDFREEMIKYLKSLRENYNLYLLSNTNEIHSKIFEAKYVKTYGEEFRSLFKKTYLSYEIKLRKPEKEIFGYMLSDGGMKAEETLFIDDIQRHLETAGSLGIKTLQFIN